MTVFDVLILAVVEGITEFLPISSTGHLVLTSHILNLSQTPFVKTFEIVIQLGAILAVVMLYWRTLLIGPAVWLRIGIAFLPTAIVGFTLYSVIKSVLLGNVMITLSALCIGGILLIVLAKVQKEKPIDHKDIKDIPLKRAFFIGLAQSVSVIPGVSRSAASIIGGQFAGLNRETAVMFSFLLAVPTMAAATGLDLIESNFSFTQEEFILLSIGFVMSFLVAVLAIKLFLNYVKNHSFVVFGVYRILLSVIYWFFLIR